MNNPLRVKASEFKTDLSFNDWAKKYQVSTLVPQNFEPYNKKLDNYSEKEKDKMIESVYFSENQKSNAIGKVLVHRFMRVLKLA